MSCSGRSAAACAALAAYDLALLASDRCEGRIKPLAQIKVGALVAFDVPAVGYSEGAACPLPERPA